MTELLGDRAGAVAASPSSTLVKAFDLLDAFDHDHRVLTLSEIARRSGLPKTTTHRLLTSLVDARVVDRTAQGYRIGLRMFSMGRFSLEVQIRDIALPYLERLRRLTRQTVHLGVLDNQNVVYLEKLTSHLSPATPAVVGGHLPAASTGVGKVLLAFGDATLTSHPASCSPRLRDHLEHVRRNGLAGDREESAPGLACVASPIMSGNRVVAAISVAFAVGDGSGKLFADPLCETSAAIGRALTGITAGRLQPGRHPAGRALTQLVP